MDIHIKYLIGTIACIVFAVLLVMYYNNGKGIMHSAKKCLALASSVVFFLGGIFLGNLSASHTWQESLLEVFNNLTCALLVSAIAFIFKKNLLSIKKPEPFNEDINN